MPEAKGPTDSFQTEWLPRPTVMVAALFLGVCLYVRFYHLDSLSVWPVLDEGRNAYFSWRLSQHWDGRFFYDVSQMPPLYYWIQSIFYRFLKPSLFSLWLFPSLVSLGCLPLAYGAARFFFSRSFSLLFLVLMGTSFYPVYVGRFNHQAGLIVFWELAAMSFLGWLLKSSRLPVKKKAAVFLGLILGTGFYIYFAWPFFVLALILWLIVLVWTRSPELPRETLKWVFVPAFLVLIPLGWAAFQAGYGNYLHSLLNKGSDFDPGIWLNNSFSFLTGLFWGLDTPAHAYKPFWGGFFNPLLTACFFLGLLAIGHQKEKKLKAVLAGLLIFCLPAFFTKEISFFRIVTVLPFLILVAAAGLQLTAARVPSRFRTGFLILFLLVSAGVDFYHLAGPYQAACSNPVDHWASYSKSIERYRAYGLLKTIAEKDGKGLFLSQFDPFSFDKTLEVALGPYTYSLDEIHDARPVWVGFLMNYNLKPWFEKKFPKSRIIPLSDDLQLAEGEMTLVVIPVEELSAPILESWVKADEALAPADWTLINLNIKSSRLEVLSQLGSAYPAFQGDPFLETVFWNWVYLNHSADHDLEKAKGDLNNIITRGCPNAYAYNELGSLLAVEGKRVEAKAAFTKAIGCKVNRTPALENLKALQSFQP